ncbi:transcriptional regulator PpsR [Jiella sp. MQZ9-1]|uniref:Transcriptional regulator PpsR n=1 Tax=Jiella flava TaxID=2816857 RepID=A0A939FYP6_9HYPH|nr:transcriptional regulator PpsR [Jiella flava]MCD2471885.1 transcriptional regulator PpsR [Jiella flava]
MVANLVTATTDVALLLDSSGTIADVAIRETDLFADAEKQWVGCRFIDVVTTESRQKVERLLSRDRDSRGAGRSEINHPMPSGPDLPISYSVLPLTKNGARIALGRDLRTMAALQQNLVETQLALETDYARLRIAETQYRVLFDTAAEPIVIIDAASGRITDANLSARQRFERDGRRLAGFGLGNLFASTSLSEADRLLAAARGSGEAEIRKLTAIASQQAEPVSAQFYRQQGTGRIILRFIGTQQALASHRETNLIARVGQILPDGIVVIGADRLIHDINESFLDISEIASRSQAIGRPLDEIVGRRGVELNILMKAIDADGFVGSFGTVLNSRFSGGVEVEISGSAIIDGDKRYYGFSIRRAQRSFARPAPATPFRSANDMTGLVGRVPLREIIRETADIIEQLCIEAALELTRNNRASAAEMLGLSRQSLYSKLRRHNIAGSVSDNGADSDEIQ